MRNDLFTTRRPVPIIRDNDPKLQTAIANGQGDYVRIFIMINNVFIGHAGLILGEGEDAFLYDPAGTYEGCEEKECRGSVQSFRGSGDFFEYPEFDWDSYLKFYLDDGEDIVLIEFIVPRSQMEHMRDNVLYYSDTADNFYCASNVARVLRESGGVFNNIPDEFFAPWGLKKHLLNIQSQKGVVPHVFITMPPHRPFQ
ncbi:hypothetical protein AB6H26_01965 [Providencia hangzhouensis]|uniref:hypothetical protein n=1 Tax=Providencia TaxID=586 RepID=UPI0013740703|nr:hypothetical protein [Providencia rettgeri]BBU99144.1 hypothetical protein BML2526_07970 [Providencia rettgeri]BBV14114.1 hypothetical protein BML2576_35730 [Providencia rettgeri]BDH20255.1 hypothetical protein PrNR1418_35460 [Providencia rettgeri]